jgi:hypothetical protein
LLVIPSDANLARAGVPRRVAMSVMRHSDGKLTDKIYTDENLLGVETADLSGITITNSLTKASHGMSWRDTGCHNPCFERSG